MGAINQLPCQVIDPAQGRLRCGDHTIAAPAPLALATGADTTGMVRPEGLRLGTEGGSNRLTGRVTAVTFRGSLVRVQLQVGAGISLMLDALNNPHLTLPRPGEMHAVSFTPEAVWLMNDSD